MKKGLILVFLLLTSQFIVNVKAEEKYPYIIEETPVLDSEYLYFENASTGQILFEKKADDLMYPASLTKVMTCLLALDHFIDLDQEVVITEQMVEGLWEMNASVAELVVGRSYPVLDLLYGAMLPSGADAVRALALTISGSLSEFTELMNAKAKDLKMQATHFTNVDGLHNSDHYSRAKDLSLLLKEALNYPVFCELSSSPAYTLSDGHKVYSSLFFFAKDEIIGLKGGKTGFTGPAGRCLMSYGEIRNNTLVAISGKASEMNHISDAKKLYEWYNDDLQTIEAVSDSKLIAEIEVIDSKDDIVLSFYPSSSYILDVEKDAEIREVTDIPEVIYAPIKKDQTLGCYKVYINDQLVYSEELKADKDIERSYLKYYLRLIQELFLKN